MWLFSYLYSRSVSKCVSPIYWLGRWIVKPEVWADTEQLERYVVVPAAVIQPFLGCYLQWFSLRYGCFPVFLIIKALATQNITSTSSFMDYPECKYTNSSPNNPYSEICKVSGLTHYKQALKHSVMLFLSVKNFKSMLGLFQWKKTVATINSSTGLGKCSLLRSNLFYR